VSTVFSSAPYWVDVAALVISIPVVLGGLVETAMPLKVSPNKNASAKHRAGALTFVGAFLVVAVMAVAGFPATKHQVRTAVKHEVDVRPNLTFVEPATPPDGGPALVSCHAEVIVRGSVPNGDALALASEQAQTSVFYFESAVTPGPESHEWSGSLTLGNISSTGDKFTIYAIAVPRQWESYLVQAVNWTHRTDTDWAESTLPPHAVIAARVIVEQKNSNC
jgi:hypothetical protein